MTQKHSPTPPVDVSPRHASEQRVVVTGMGALTPVGDSAETSWQSVRAGRSGIKRIQAVDVADLAVQIGGEIRGFDPLAVIPRSDVRRLDSHAWYAFAAAQEAMHGNLDIEGHHPFDPLRFGVSVGTSSGPVSLIQQATRALDQRGPRLVPPGVVIYGGADSAAAYLSQRLGAMGSSMGVSATCASGAVAVGEAMRAIRHGYADAFLVVGADNCLNRVNLAANANIRSLTTAHNDSPHQASRPFDRARSGFVMSSGAAAVLLESAAHAAARGAKVFGEILGYASTSDAYHATAPHPDGAGAATAMQLALSDAGVGVEQVNHINAHGTSTQLNDATEVLAIQRVFGQDPPPVTSTKSTTGHLLGAAGVLEMIFSLLSMRDQVIPPTINLDDLEFDIDVVAHSERSAKLHRVLSNSFGFGGHNASLLLGMHDSSSL